MTSTEQVIKSPAAVFSHVPYVVSSDSSKHGSVKLGDEVEAKPCPVNSKEDGGRSDPLTHLPRNDGTGDDRQSPEEGTSIQRIETSLIEVSSSLQNTMSCCWANYSFLNHLGFEIARVFQACL